MWPHNEETKLIISLVEKQSSKALLRDYGSIGNNKKCQ